MVSAASRLNLSDMLLSKEQIKKKVKKALTRKEKQFLKDLDESIKWVKLHQEGKVKSITIEELLANL